MSKKFSIPRGAADILPEEALVRQNIESTARNLFNLYNYKEIQTPCFEETDLFARSMGQSSDVVKKQMLNLKSQKDDDSASNLSLRPEATASVLRSYIENHLDRKESLTKLFYIGPMFRGERPQKGRLRQFHQIGVEAIGPNSTSSLLDAEVIALSVNILKSLGLKGFTLRINTLGMSEDRENFSKWLREQLKSSIGSLSEDLQKSFKENVFRILDSKDKKAAELVKKLKLDYSYLSTESQEYFGKVKSALKEMGVDFEEDPSLVRGLDYYTHTVFEISDKSLGSQDALGAGGRYNNLAKQLGGNAEVYAVGFALGLERILLAMDPNKTFATQDLSYYIIALDESFLSKAFMLLNNLRANEVSADLNYKTGSVKSQMRAANKVGAKYVVILGEDEIVKNEVTIKDMEKGDQQTISLEEFEQFIKENR